ncbi:histone deacetylase family protein [Methylophilus aquaticus]|uniref:Histone deacetylase n=1 Tax=Methylophilus aquaticus TaxID=1971610 RepID=A0ABT9JTT3_9PROT|nr:histone deacetylase [Methylophilus aquaticus]MDP8567884.1 histone deacetylase [Methylophilus aquaticus]
MRNSVRAYLLSMLCWAVTPCTTTAAERLPVTMVYDARLLSHDVGPGHPENAARLSHIVTHLQQHPLLNHHLRWPIVHPATEADLLRVHTPEYLAQLEAAHATLLPGQYLTLSTGDTVISQGSLAVAKLATGAALAGVDAVMQQQSKAAFALVRPPGHHATANRGMGFCIYNHVAVAARYAQQQYGVRHVLIVDIDVHHGNGTQAIFDADQSVFYFSAHQHPLYPGTGLGNERGEGVGLGTTMNIQVPAGSSADRLLNAWQQQLVPAMQNFRPELIIVSAGLDAHTGDYLGQLRYSDAAYAAIANHIQVLANRYAQGRMVWVLEGGYVPANNAQAVEAILTTLTN